MTEELQAQADRALLEVSGLAAGYGDLRVVWDVSFPVRPGRVVALLGRNGVGKTTTLRAIAGLNRAVSGSVTFDGHDVTRLPAHQRVRKGIAYVQEGKRIFHRRTVEENLLIGGYSRGLRRRQLPSAVSRIYELFPALRTRAKASAGSLSGGQQQIVAIGQALMAQPSLLMLDEPSGGLAPALVTELMGTISELATAGLGILMVEQAVEAALRVADDVVVLDNGVIALEGPAASIDDVAILRDAYFGQPIKVEER